MFYATQYKMHMFAINKGTGIMVNCFSEKLLILKLKSFTQ